MAARALEDSDWEDVGGGDEWEDVAPAQPVPAPSMLDYGKEVLKQAYRPALEGAGAVLGGIAGSTLGPLGTVGGGGLGFAAGRAAANTIDQLMGAPVPPATQQLAEVPGNILEGAAYEMAGPIIGKGVGALAEKGAPLLKEAAKRQYSRVLTGGAGGGTKEQKMLVEKVVPKMLEQKERALTRGGLQRRAGARIEQFGEELEAAYDALPQDAKVEVLPVIQGLEKAKNNLKVAGTDEIVDEQLHKALTKVQHKILDIAKDQPEVSVATARSARQKFESVVRKKTRIFGKTGKETAKLEAEKEASNEIRAEMARERPDIARINEKFSLWKTVDEILDETTLRTRAHATPLGERLLTGAGAAGGFAKGGISTAAAYAATMKLLSKVINSTAWRTVSAVEKNRIADLLAAGNTANAQAVLSQIISRGTQLTGSALQSEEEPAPAPGPQSRLYTPEDLTQQGYKKVPGGWAQT